MKHAVAAALVLAAVAPRARANSCPDATFNGDPLINFGEGFIPQNNNADLNTYTITGACLDVFEAAPPFGFSIGTPPSYTKDPEGCFNACMASVTITDADGNPCTGGGMFPPAAIGWNDDTKMCTCFGDSGNQASDEANDYRRADLDDDDYGCVYCEYCLEFVACGADGDVEVEVSQPGTLTFDNFNCDTDLDDAQAAIESALEEMTCPAGADLDSFGCGCEATVTKLDTEDCDADGADPTLTVEYKVATVADLEDTDYDFAAQVVDALGRELDVDLTSNYLATAFVADVAAAAPGIFTVAAAGVTLVATLDDIESDILDEFKKWYPNWHDGGDEHTCKNDGQYPAYMGLTGSFFQPSLDDCCDQYYGWAKTQCMIDGGANAAEYITGHYYVDWESGTCKQDCLEDTPGKNCGGLKQAWQETFEDADDCCDERLFWVNQKACVAESQGVELDDAVLGSDAYFVDWKTQKCVKDCVKNASSDADCGGLAKHWDELYDSKSECCSTRLWYVDEDECNE